MSNRVFEQHRKQLHQGLKKAFGAIVSILTLAACTNSNPMVELLESARRDSLGLQVSDFSPSTNPTNSTGAKSVQVSANTALWTSFKAEVATGVQECANIDFSASTEMSLPGSFTFTTPTETTYKVCVIGKKATGEWQSAVSAWQSHPLSVDLTPPSHTLFTTQAQPSFSGPLQVEFNFTEEMQLLTANSFNLTNAVFTTASKVSAGQYVANFLPMTDGTVVVEFVPTQIFDLAGNMLADSALQISRVSDQTPPGSPTISINSGATHTNNIAVSVSLSAISSPWQMYLTKTAGCVTGGTWTSFSSLTSFNVDPETSTTVYAKFRDNALNESACVSDSIIHDSVLPVLSFSNPPPSWVKNPFTFTVTTSEPLLNGLLSSHFQVSNASITSIAPSATNGNSVSYNVNVQPTSQAPVTVALAPTAVQDLAGNYNNASLTVSTTYDTTSPSTPSIAVNSVPHTFDRTANFTVTSTDTGSGINYYKAAIYHHSTNAVIVSPTVVPATFELNGLSLLENTEYRLELYVADNAGNLSSTTSKVWRTFQRPWILKNWTMAPDDDVLAIETFTDGSIVLGGKFKHFGTQSNFSKFGMKLTAAAAIDLSFNGNIGFDDTVVASLVTADDHVYVGGHFTSYKGQPVKYFARLKPNGDLDTAYNSNVKFDGPVLSIALDTTGRIIVGGFFDMYGLDDAQKIARLNTDGTLDAGFNTSIGFDQQVEAVMVHTDGSIIAGGNFSRYGVNATPANSIARLNPNGTIDTSFQVGVGFDLAVTSLDEDSQQRIIVGGYFNGYGGTTIRRIARLLPNGTLDPGFSTSTDPDGTVHAVAVGPGDQIYIGGEFVNVTASPRRRLARLDADGSLDNTFSPAFGFSSGAVYSIAPAGSDVIVGGSFVDYDYGVARRIIRLTSTGTVQSSMNFDLGFVGESVRTLSLFSDGSLYVGGKFASYGGTSARYLAKVYDGTSVVTPDTAFNAAMSSLDGYVFSLKRTSSDMLIGGSFSNFGTPTAKLAKISSTGVVDTTFASNTSSGTDNDVLAIDVQSTDQKILVGGSFTSFAGNYSPKLVRLNPDGTHDSSFVTASGFNDAVRTVGYQSTAKRVIVGGLFTTYQSLPRNRLIGLYSQNTAGGNVAGDIDSTFDIGDGFNGPVHSIAVQPDEKILVGGSFTAYNGRWVNNLIRLLPNGDVDETFFTNIGDGASTQVNQVYYSASDDKILVAGDFWEFNNKIVAKIVRLFPDGTIDPSFSAGFGFTSAPGVENTIHTVKVLSNGNIAVGGFYFNYMGLPTHNFSILKQP